MTLLSWNVRESEERYKALAMSKTSEAQSRKQSEEALRDQLRDAREANHHVEVRELRSESESSSESVAW